MTSELAIRKVELEGELGDNLGLGFGPVGGDPPWSPRDARRIRSATKDGLRAFYFCGHAWSFMRQTAKLLLPIGETVVDMPIDYGGVDGETTVLVSQKTDGQGQVELRFEGISTVNRDLQLNLDRTGWPMRIAQRPKKMTPVGQMGRDELVVAPIADQDYILSFEYLVTPDYAVNELQPYVFGGVEHHGTVLALCRAAAEVIIDNRVGPQTGMAQQLLARSIKVDRLKHPQKLGYNRDLSDHLVRDPHWLERQWPNYKGGVMYNGQLFDE